MSSNNRYLFIAIICFGLVGLLSFKDKIFKTSSIKKTVEEVKEVPKSKEAETHDHSNHQVSKISNKEKIPERKIFKGIPEKEKKIVVDFQDRRDELILELPLVTDLQDLKEGEAHHITPGLLQTGRRLSSLKELVLKYPELKPLQEEANDFYETCAGDRDFPTSIRSLCLFSRLQLAKNREEAFDISPYPLEIKQMVLELAPSKN